MPFEQHLKIRSKIRTIEASLPIDMSAEAKQLRDLAAWAYELNKNELVQQIRAILRKIQKRAGGSGEKIPDFPLAGDARRAVYNLETVSDGAHL